MIWWITISKPGGQCSHCGVLCMFLCRILSPCWPPRFSDESKYLFCGRRSSNHIRCPSARSLLGQQVAADTALRSLGGNNCIYLDLSYTILWKGVFTWAIWNHLGRLEYWSEPGYSEWTQAGDTGWRDTDLATAENSKIPRVGVLNRHPGFLSGSLYLSPLPPFRTLTCLIDHAFSLLCHPIIPTM